MNREAKRTPVILQMEAVECGAACLGMVLARYRKYVPLEQLRVDCSVSRDGSSAKYICRAATHYGLRVKAYRMTLEQLYQCACLPAILHWSFNHFVVLCGFQGGKAILNDPASGRRAVTHDELDRCFTGVVLTFCPGEDFVPGGKPSGSLGFVRDSLLQNKGAVLFLLTMGLLLALTGLVKPVFYKVFTDSVLIGANADRFQSLLAAMGITLIAAALSEALRDLYLAKLQAKLRIGAGTSFLWHILRLPVSFFSQRFAGDISSRRQTNDQIAKALCTQLLPMTLDMILLGVYFAIMLSLNEPLALLGMVFAVIEVAVLALVSRQGADLVQAVQRDIGKLSGAVVAAASTIETIKAGGAEDGSFQRLAGYQCKYSNTLLALHRKNTALGVLPRLLTTVSADAVLAVGVYHIFSGHFTIGTLMAFQSFMSLFLDPVGSLAASIQAFQQLEGDVARTQDVMRYPADVPAVYTPGALRGRQLSGLVELREVTFGYAPLAPPLIEGFSLTARPGSMIAFVGGSGSGKSTLAKLIAGLYSPTRGQIRFDGIPRQELDRYTLTGSLAVVDQDSTLFSGTVRENLTLWDDTIPQELVVSACRDAYIHEDIMSLQDGYGACVWESGGNFSGGQRQRLEIARALVGEPSILVLDEATSALDPVTELAVMDAIRRRGVTCFVIAHRLSTVRDADMIVVLDYGQEVERGTHRELMSKNGRYAQLIQGEEGGAAT